VVLSLGFCFSSAFGYYGKELCAYPQFRCVAVKKGDTWAKLWPNPDQREIVMRLNRTNEPLSVRSWVVVPRNFAAISLLDLSPYPMHVAPTNEKWIRVDLGKQAFAAYSAGGQLLRWGPVSAGRDYCPDTDDACTTPTGSFHIQVMKGADCISTLFPVTTKGGAPMPYCMFFHGGYALHGSMELPGYNASHGCIRLLTGDARWLNEDFASVGTKVVVNP
jgi:L,D-transpeptidase ErfK/SrfK